MYSREISHRNAIANHYLRAWPSSGNLAARIGIYFFPLGAECDFTGFLHTDEIKELLRRRSSVLLDDPLSHI
jgi:hypothetical protein